MENLYGHSIIAEICLNLLIKRCMALLTHSQLQTQMIGTHATPAQAPAPAPRNWISGLPIEQCIVSSQPLDIRRCPALWSLQEWIRLALKLSRQFQTISLQLLTIIQIHSGWFGCWPLKLTSSKGWGNNISLSAQYTSKESVGIGSSFPY